MHNITFTENNIKQKHLDIVSPKKFFKSKKKNCEICNSSKLEIFQKIGRIGSPLEYGKLIIVICKKCGHKFINPIYEDQFYKFYYNKIYRKIAFGDMTPSKKYLFYQKKRGKGIFDFFDKRLKTMGNNFLDHGCASGLTMLPWQKKWNCFGIDPHKPSVAYGKNQLNLKIKCAYGESLPFKKNFFDVILSLGSLEHSYDIKKSMKEIVRTINENGFLIIRWRSNQLIGSPLEYYNHNHYRFFSKETWNSLLLKYGFSQIKHFDEDIEGYKSYSYILAKFKRNNSNLVKKKKKNVYKRELANYKKYLNKYYKICLELKKLLDIKNNFSSKKIFIKKNNISLLNIGKKSSIERFCSEALSFLKYVELKK